jgi:hypothetical protein
MKRTAVTVLVGAGLILAGAIQTAIKNYTVHSAAAERPTSGGNHGKR